MCDQLSLRYYIESILVLVSVWIILCTAKPNRKPPPEPFQEKSPFNQHLPDCTAENKEYPYISKKTNAKAILCPMFKDEEGFLSEWVAYYQMHGFDHIMMFDDGSVDNSLVEIKPWIDSGFVSIKQNWTVESLNLHHGFRKNEFKKNMAMKALLETECKMHGISLGYDMTVSIDIDEYIIPKQIGTTVVDEMFGWFVETGRSAQCLDKLNFQEAPHTLEPVHLLTIEAYQTRMRQPRKMSYYTTVAVKCGYRLKADFFSNATSEFIAKCCHFHGCQGTDFIADSKFCTTHYGEEAVRVNGKGKKWMDPMYINHYARSLEKYAIKGKTWKTATGEIQKGESAEAAAKSYDIPKFLARNTGWYYDATALRYSCQLRDTLRNMTGENVYLRPGNIWYRNPEFGKDIIDPDKRGRYGRANAPGFKFEDGNMFHYHGKKYSGILDVEQHKKESH